MAPPTGCLDVKEGKEKHIAWRGCEGCFWLCCFHIWSWGSEGKKRLAADVMHSGCCWLFKRQAGLPFEAVGAAVVVSASSMSLMFRLVVCSTGMSSGNMSVSLLTLLPVNTITNYYYKILRLKLSQCKYVTEKTEFTLRTFSARCCVQCPLVWQPHSFMLISSNHVTFSQPTLECPLPLLVNWSGAYLTLCYSPTMIWLVKNPGDISCIQICILNCCSVELFHRCRGGFTH